MITQGAVPTLFVETEKTLCRCTLYYHSHASYYPCLCTTIPTYSFIFIHLLLSDLAMHVHVQCHVFTYT